MKKNKIKVKKLLGMKFGVREKSLGVKRLKAIERDREIGQILYIETSLNLDGLRAIEN